MQLVPHVMTPSLLGRRTLHLHEHLLNVGRSFLAAGALPEGQDALHVCGAPGLGLGRLQRGLGPAQACSAQLRTVMVQDRMLLAGQADHGQGRARIAAALSPPCWLWTWQAVGMRARRLLGQHTWEPAALGPSSAVPCPSAQGKVISTSLAAERTAFHRQALRCSGQGAAHDTHPASTCGSTGAHLAGCLALGQPAQPAHGWPRQATGLQRAAAPPVRRSGSRQQAQSAACWHGHF